MSHQKDSAVALGWGRHVAFCRLGMGTIAYDQRRTFGALRHLESRQLNHSRLFNVGRFYSFILPVQ
jgi:hypothetical protein